jgi:plastocyanin
MHKSSLLSVIAAVLAVLFCSAPRADAANFTVQIKKQTYVPATVEINVGDTVTWINDDDEGHTATRTDAPAFGTPLLSKGQAASILFSQISPPSGFEYFCVPHPFMKANVVVRPAGVHVTSKPTNDKPVAIRPARTVEVHIKDQKFVLEVVEIQVGDTVKWINDDEEGHTATRTDNPSPFDTGLLLTGGSGSFTFNTPSSGMGFEYFCVPHPFMRGRVVVKLQGSHLLGDGHKRKK